MKNILGRELPEYIEGYGKVTPYGTHISETYKIKETVKNKNNGDKVLPSIREALIKCGIKDGMTISFHHHLRNGDYVLNQVLEEIKKLGIQNIKVAASSIFPIHAPMVDLIEKGVVTKIITNYISGPVARAVSEGKLREPIVMMTHGGRPRAIESGDLKIDMAFIGAPACDDFGNINGVDGRAACGSLGYTISDAMYAEKVVAVTDNLVPYPACPIEISQIYVDYVVKIDEIGDPSGIVSGTTKITKNPIGLKIAKETVKVIKYSGLLKDGMSFQTGAGGTSLAVAKELKDLMIKEKVTGSFASGGTTSYIVDMLNEGLFKYILDVQCFDSAAVKSYKENKNHMGMSASMYGNPNTKGSVVDKLDIMILGATEIDLDYNVNVTTGSDGVLMGGSGGHSDTAYGAKLSIVVTNLIKGRLPIIKDRVTTVTTPGSSIDILVTERGISVNPKRQDLIEKLKSNIKLVKIEDLKEIAENLTGKPKEIKNHDKIIGVAEYRDGSVIDVIRRTDF
ncbi:MAG: citrate lyase subunit alpha [Clostridiaceae bacterium]